MPGPVPHGRIFEEKINGVITRENSHYLRHVLRLKPGSLFHLTTGQGEEVKARLESAESYSAIETLHPEREPKIAVSLFPGLLKGDRYESIIEKSVELGVSTIVPLSTSRCVVKNIAAGKQDRWNKIALSAMLQCGGCLKPDIKAPSTIPDLPHPPSGVYPIILHETPTAKAFPLHPPAGIKEVWIASGPEGGFDDDEVTSLIGLGWKPVHLGPRLLRADTAPIAALAAIVLADPR